MFRHRALHNEGKNPIITTHYWLSPRRISVSPHHLSIFPHPILRWGLVGSVPLTRCNIAFGKPDGRRSNWAFETMIKSPRMFREALSSARESSARIASVPPPVTDTTTGAVPRQQLYPTRCARSRAHTPFLTSPEANVWQHTYTKVPKSTTRHHDYLSPIHENHTIPTIAKNSGTSGRKRLEYDIWEPLA